MARDERPYWLDQLFEKHECFPYGESEILKTELDGHKIKVILPKYYPAATVIKCGLADSLLVIIGETTEEHLQSPMGVLIVAKQRDKNVYETVIWHELFPWALTHLGLKKYKMPRRYYSKRK
jgi:hypothetical protein